MTEEQKAAQRKGDDIDDVNTTDLENIGRTEIFGTSDEEPEGLDQFEYFENNRINLARAFLGYKGGYTIRQLKKFFK